jgi:hypothetical protein
VSVPSGDPERTALALIAPWMDDPPARAQRIAALYASLYLEDPLLQSWAGLASFVAHQVANALRVGSPADEALARGNLLIYLSMMPPLLEFRAGGTVEGPMAPGFALLRDADGLARTDLAAATANVARAVEQFSLVEQRDVAAELYTSMSAAMGAALAHVYVFRLGWDSAAEVLRFHGDDIRDEAQRVAWATDAVLPAWERARRVRAEWLRADCDRNRRAAGVRLEDLPPRAR